MPVAVAHSPDVGRPKSAPLARVDQSHASAPTGQTDPPPGSNTARPSDTVLKSARPSSKNNWCLLAVFHSQKPLALLRAQWQLRTGKRSASLARGACALSGDCALGMRMTRSTAIRAIAARATCRCAPCTGSSTPKGARLAIVCADIG